MSLKIKKAVFPVAGLGTRFLPATKANPKEMLPIVDKPLIQYAVEEAISAGIQQLIFVTSSSKRAIEDHFDSNYELESNLEARGNYKLLSLVREILPKGVSCVYVRQPNPMGLGHAVLCAKDIIGNEPFAVLLADDLITGDKLSCLQQLMHVYENKNSSIIAVQEIAMAEVHKYGIIALENTTGRITAIIEKPKANEAPSNLAAVGRYILTPQIFDFLEVYEKGASGEIQLTDAIAKLLARENIYAHLLQGKRYDCGSKLGYLQATISYALQHPELADSFKDYLRDLVNKELDKEKI
jgi:UTP--glucose-1-phosphate uridylyltransferase